MQGLSIKPGMVTSRDVSVMSADGQVRTPNREQSVRWIVRVGMLQLSVSGLSEPWLLAYAGDLHWRMLEVATGVGSHEWSDDEGRRLYASFIGYEVAGTLLAGAAEGAMLDCDSRLKCARRNRHMSVHRLRCSSSGRTAMLTLISSFVRRDAETNRGFVRATRIHSMTDHEPVDAVAEELLSVRRDMRQAALTEYEKASLSMRVCTMEDFNGLGVIYFANYPRMLDRAERMQRFGDDSADAAVLDPLRTRRCFYYGNANGGERLRAGVSSYAGGSMVHLWGDHQRLLCVAIVDR